VIFRRLRLLNKNQLGFTLIELLLILALTGAVTSATTATVFQVFDGNTRSSNQMEAIRQAQNAGYWVSHDAKMAQVIHIGDKPGTTELELVKLNWTEWNNTAHQASYTLQDTELWRDYDGQSRLVAKYIDPDPTNTSCGIAAGSSFNLPDNNDAFTITSAAGGDSGIITVATGSISVTKTGTATYNSGTGAWTTPSAGDTIVVAASSDKTTGKWTSTAGTAIATITTDTDNDVTFSGGVLVFTVTARVGVGSQQQTEVRVYEVIPRPTMI
jgi:type II secretory pathway pseudopilin PulG